MSSERKVFGNLIEETMNNLEAEVNTLKSQEQRLKVSISELQVMKNKLAEEIAEGEKQQKADKETAERKKNEMGILAQQKLDNAQKQESNANTKVGELDKKLQEAKDLIKHYQDLAKTVEAQKEVLDTRLNKFNELVAQIKKV